MSRSKYTNAVCSVIVAVSILITVIFMNGELLGVTAMASEMPYVSKLFSTDRVHTIDIVANEEDWQNMLDTASSEEYISCNLVIDGESFKNAAIRPKGNSSLSTVSSSDSDRYSFKVEFDHDTDGKTYYGLDKLCLNNIIQDSTYMKDFLSYHMMQTVGADSPLCSYVYITVNGEDWGLYAAVEGVEDSFVERTYASEGGQLYKPDSLSMNNFGGNENGQNAGGFNREDRQKMFQNGNFPQLSDSSGNSSGTGNDSDSENTGQPVPPESPASSNSSDNPANPETSPVPSDSTASASENGGQDLTGGQDGQMPGFGSFNPDNAGGMANQLGGMGGSGGDTSLIYSDDSYDSYSNIFDNAKFDLTDADKDRLIASLKDLNHGENIDQAVDTDEVIRYFVAHNFVLNGDSYTGSMIHNYYLYEDDGQLSMIAWDYNLAFGSFSMGRSGSGSDSATALVNYPIDSPLLSGTLESRPMLAWIFNDDTYLTQYHQVFDEFISTCFESGYFENLIDSTIEMISPYVEKDPTAFCTYDEFLSAAQTLKEFCLLRAESVRGQLEGTIPSTSEGQEADSSALIDASDVNISETGSMGGGNGGMGNFGGRNENGGGNGGNNGQNMLPGNSDSSSDGEQQSSDGQSSENNSSSAEIKATAADIPESSFAITATAALANQTADTSSDAVSGQGNNGGGMPNQGGLPGNMQGQGGSAPESIPGQNGTGSTPEGMPNPNNTGSTAEEIPGQTNHVNASSGSEAASRTDTTSSQTESGSSSSGSDQNTGNTNQGGFNMPGNFNNQNGQNNPFSNTGQNTAETSSSHFYSYLLFGVSILILAAGVIFAAKYKR